MRPSSRLFFSLSAALVACGGSAPRTSVVTTPAPSTTAAPTVPVAASDGMEETVRLIQKNAAAAKPEELVRSLVTDVGARLAAGPKDAAAVAWATHAMEAAGLTRVHAEPVKMPRWLRGQESVEIVGGKKLVAIGLGGSVGTPSSGINAEIVEVESLAALEKLEPAAVKGKIVFVNATMRRTKDGTGYGEIVGARFSGPVVAGEKGAAALVLRSVGTDTETAHTGASRKAKIPGFALSGESSEQLHAALAKNPKTRLKLLSTDMWAGEGDSANVIGDIVGREAPDEIVLMGAHLDSWDVGQGAIDDGAGVAIVIGAAKLLTQVGRAPRRTVRVVLFANEEAGVVGGKDYAQRHAAELPKHVAAMEADSGTAKVYGVRFAGGKAAAPAWDAVTKFVAPLGVEREEKRAGGGADTQPMHLKGVPAVNLSQDFSLYFDVHHTERDTLDRIDPEGLRQSASAYATTVWVLADGGVDLGRAPEPTEK